MASRGPVKVHCFPGGVLTCFPTMKQAAAEMGASKKAITRSIATGEPVMGLKWYETKEKTSS